MTRRAPFHTCTCRTKHRPLTVPCAASPQPLHPLGFGTPCRPSRLLPAYPFRSPPSLSPAVAAPFPLPPSHPKTKFNPPSCQFLPSCLNHQNQMGLPPPICRLPAEANTLPPAGFRRQRSLICASLTPPSQPRRKRSIRRTPRSRRLTPQSRPRRKRSRSRMPRKLPRFKR
jgi:hypothetical protein